MMIPVSRKFCFLNDKISKMNLEKLVRKNIWNLKPYSSARNEFKGNDAKVFLDANENPLNEQYNRYPDPLQVAIKEKIGKIRKVEMDNIFFGNGSDEPIDIVIRVFCEPRVDNIVSIDPTYGMYQVCADINDVEYRSVLLNEDFSFSADNLLKKVDANTKLIFLCSPNNPTANILCKDEIEKILKTFTGIVVIDEAYIDFTESDSWLPSLKKYPNMVILQTLSKAWGLAGIRFGMAFSSPEIIALFNKVKYPYNINSLSQEYVFKQLDRIDEKTKWVKNLLEQRTYLEEALKIFPNIMKVYPSNANFILIKIIDANRVYTELVKRGIIVRNRDSVTLCKDCLRVTVGTEQENKELINALAEIVK